MSTDDKIRARLSEVAGFTPWDKWDHALAELRAGKIYYVQKSAKPGYPPNCMILNPHPKLVRAFLEHERDQDEG